MPPLTIQPTTCHRRRCRRRHPQARPLDQLAQRALQDLLSVAGLEHEDSWEAATAPDPLPQTPQQQQPPPPPASGQHPTLAGVPTTARRPSVHLGASGPSAASELAAVYAPEEPLPPAAGFEDDDGSGLPAAAALRLYQARLRAAQANLVGLQAALKAKEAKLGGLEKEAQQLRWVLKVQCDPRTVVEQPSVPLRLPFIRPSACPSHTDPSNTSHLPPATQAGEGGVAEAAKGAGGSGRAQQAGGGRGAGSCRRAGGGGQADRSGAAGGPAGEVRLWTGGWQHVVTWAVGCQGSADVQIHADVQEGRQSKMPS